MDDWQNLPIELLAHLYSYLPRRDRLACSLVCQTWRNGLDHVMLWKRIVVHIDTDLMEPSTLLLLRDYCKYIKNLEFGWSVPHRDVGWSPEKYKELTKRAVRFLLILYNGCIQITCLKVFNWFDFMSFGKVAYHFSRFLKNQMCLTKIVFDNINMHSTNFNKLLSSCLGSSTTITNLDIRGCYFYKSSFDSTYFKSCIEQLSYLTTFKLDYFILSCQLIDSILVSGNKSLENLEVVLKESIWQSHVIDDTQWVQLCSVCPKLKVTLIIKNVYHYGELMIYLTQGIPVVSLSFIVPRVLDMGGGCNFRKCLNLFVINYCRTLETVNLHIRNDYEDLDETLLMMIRKCSKIKSFVFNGYLEDPQRLRTSFKEITCFCTATEGQHVFRKVTKDEMNGKRHKRVKFKLLKRSNGTTCSLFILN